VRERPPPQIRLLWLACILLTAGGIGICAGILSWLGGMNPPTAILTGGAAFSAATLLLLTIERFLTSADI
jgi:hypothetical protein